jgi:hypothetical protein
LGLPCPPLELPALDRLVRPAPLGVNPPPLIRFDSRWFLLPLLFFRFAISKLLAEVEVGSFTLFLVVWSTVLVSCGPSAYLDTLGRIDLDSYCWTLGPIRIVLLEVNLRNPFGRVVLEPTKLDKTVL